MTCSRNFRRVLQLSSLGLIGMLAVAGCGGSENPTNKDSGPIDTGAVNPSGAALNVDRAGVSIGSVDIGKSVQANIIVTNTGTAISGPIIVTPGANVTAAGCAAPLAAKASCTITITATPTMVGAFSSSISITANPGATSPILISVTGSGVPQGQFSAIPNAIELGPVVVGEAAPQQTITITATTALTDLLVTPSGANVSIDKNASTCTAALPAGGTCTIAVNFTAMSGGPKTDNIVISAGGANGRTISVPVTATALTRGRLLVTPNTAQAFETPVGTPSSAISFGVANAGDMATGQISVQISPATATDFVATSTCTLLAPLGTCTVSVVFNPAAYSATPLTASLVIADTGTGGISVTVPLSGTTRQPTALTITPTTSDLGTVKVGETGAATVYTVTNTGDAASGALTVGLSSTEFVMSNDTCTATSLPKGGVCTISVALKPLTMGAKVATLTITPLNGNAAVKNLTGTGISSAKLVAAPSSLDFGSVRINRTGTARSFVVTNEGGSASGELTISKTGSFGEFPITASTCSAALAPAGTCTVTVNFAPLTAASKTAYYTVTDGGSSATVQVNGTALDAAGISISPSPVPACSSLPAEVDDPCYNDTVVGGQGNVTTFTISAQTLPAGVADTGAITATLTGDNAGDFVISSNQCSTLLQGATCSIAVTFAPTATGLRQATLSVTSANGGNTAATLQGVGLSLVEIIADDANATQGVTGLDFGQVPVLAAGTNGNDHTYTVVVRGPRATAGHTNTVNIVLADPQQPANFKFPYENNYNPCNGLENGGVTFEFIPASGPVVAPSGWSYNAGTMSFSCSFDVRFYPQATKGDKTATLSATGSAGGQDSKTLTGNAAGLLTFDPASATFTSIQVGDSTNTQSISMVTMLDTTDNKVFTLKNNSATTNLGPITVALSGANADSFVIVRDLCSAKNLDHGATCQVVVAFMPTSIGAKTATLTATGGEETTTATLNGGGLVPINITVAPAAPDFGTVVQTVAGAWTTITVTNPEGAVKSAQVAYDLITGTNYELANGTNTSRGTCGLSGSTALAAAQSCTIILRFVPTANAGFEDPITDTLRVTDSAKGYSVDVKLTGKASSLLTITPATHGFGNVAQGQTSTAFTMTITNAGTISAPLVIPSNIQPFNVVDTGCAASSTLAAGASCSLVTTFVADAGLTLGTEQEEKFNISATGTSASVAVTLTGTSVNPAELVALGVTYTHGSPNWTTANVIHLGSVRHDSQTGSVTLWYKNIGSVPTGPLQYTWTDDDTGVAAAANTQDSQFKIVNEATNGCAGRTSLAAGATCSMTIYFTPDANSVAGSTFAKRLTVSSTNGGIAGAYILTATVLNLNGSLWVASTSGANAFLALPGTTAVDATATQVFQVTNATNLPVTRSSIDFATNTQSPDSDWDVLFTTAAAGSTACGATIAAGTSCTFAVTFTPVAYTATTAYRWGTLNLGGDGEPTTTLGVFGVVKSPATLALDVAEDGAFGQVVAGTSATKAFTVTNEGETATSVAVTVTITGANVAGKYAVASNCTAALAPNATCTGTVTLTPGTTLGAITATLSAASTGVTPATQSLTAEGVFGTTLGLSASSGLPASTMTFPVQQVGTESTVQTITLSNAENAKTSGLLTITLADTTNYKLEDNNCAGLETGLAAEEYCTVGVIFMPKTLPANATFSTTLTFSATPGGTQVLNITGTTSSALTINPDGTGTDGVVPMAAGQIREFVVALAPGAPDTAFLQTTLTGGNFIVREDQCVATKLSGGDSCLIKVELIGTTVTPVRAGVLTVNGGAGASASVTLNSATSS